MSKRLAKKVLLIGWDAADWKIINPLMDAGLMPALESLVNQGVMGNLATLDPPLSPMLWTSIATGKTADKHGILGFTEPDPNKHGIKPVAGTSRKVKALWNILSQHQLKTHVTGWWPSHPAEPVNGTFLSNFFSVAAQPLDKGWPMPQGAVHPASMREVFAELRIHPDEITEAHIKPFVPGAEKVDQEKDKALQVIAKNLAECSSLHAATTWVLENEEWDFAAIYMVALDHFCHSFMKFHPPRMAHIPEELFELYKGVVSAAYRYHDMMLGQLLQLAGDEATVVLVSDHGFHSDHLRPKFIPEEPAGPANEHSPYGIICMRGPGILRDERIYGASILDVTPTILNLFGLPAAKDMEGKVLLQALEEKTPPEYIESWENVPGECGMHPPAMQEDPWAAREAMQQLVELGYIEKPDEDTEKMMNRTIFESQFYLARVYMHKREYASALPILEKITCDNPDATRYALRLAYCYQAVNNMPACRTLINKVRNTNTRELPQLDLLEGALLLAENKPRKAMAMLNKAESTISHFPYLHIQTGNVYLRLQEWPLAQRAFLKALEIDPDNAGAHHGLAASLLRQGLYEESAEEALNAIGLNYALPSAHYHLGEALFHLREYRRAEEAFLACLSFTPGNRKAHLWLIKIYEDFLEEREKAVHHKKFIQDKIRGTITVVSGLPRSGTSMLMQMLKAGGMNILTDEVRKSDNNNPKGYFEFEKVKTLASDSSWLHEAEGKAVKIIAPLLQFLPAKFHYKIIFIRRDLAEIMRSQQVMLGKREQLKTKSYPLALAEAFKKQLEKAEAWIKSQPHADVLFVEYKDILENPQEQAENIASFLGDMPDIHAMTDVMDKTLYRNKC